MPKKPAASMPTPEELAETVSSLREQIQHARAQLLDAGVPAGLQSELADSLDRLVKMAIKDHAGDSPIVEHLSSAVEESLKLWRTEFSHSVHQLNEVFPAVQGSLATAVQLREELSEQLKKLQQQHRESLEELQRTHALQSRLNRQRKALAQSIRAERAELQLKQLRLQRQHKELQEQLDQKSEELSEARTQLSEMEQLQSIPSQQTSEIDQENQRLLSALERAEAELSDLRQQNTELAAKIAQQTTDSASAENSRGTGSQELLSWEERKKMILQQLEMETQQESDGFQEQKLEVQKIIESTEAEISRRDREIEELRAIVQTQSDARDGLAIGAAGVAQILDADELILAERQKLREIQQQWEAKLRQAEIDLSMERAKLARERAEIEAQKSQIPASTSPSASTDKNQRRWMDFLGLKEETTE